MTTDGVNVYVTDSGANTIRQVVIATGSVTTIAGSGTAAEADGTASAASFNEPEGIVTDGTNLYVTDFAGNTVRQVVIATGVVTTLAGSGTPGEASGTGAAASFDAPAGVTTDGTDLYVADQAGNAIRQVTISGGVVTTVAGSGSPSETDGTGIAAAFDAPTGITTDGYSLYVSDSLGYTIRAIK